jgi:hypothetical protein
MKKIVLLLFMLMIGGAVSAQTLTMGPKIGINWSDLIGADSSKVRSGITAGDLFVYSTMGHFGLGVDIMYSVKGAKYTRITNFATTTERWDYKLRLNYLEVPIQAIVFLAGDTSRFRPKVAIGPYIGILFNPRQTVEYQRSTDGVSTTVTRNVNVSDLYKTFDLGGVLTVGFNYRLLGRTWLNVDARYGMGFTNIEKEPVIGGLNSKARNSTFSVLVGLGVPIGDM